jgi:hypothetical protein
MKLHTAITVTILLAGLFVGILVSGCTSTTTVQKNDIDAGETALIHYVYGAFPLTDNMYFIECHGYQACSQMFINFSATHEITSIAALDRDSYGKTSGYFVVTKHDETSCKV